MQRKALEAAINDYLENYSIELEKSEKHVRNLRDAMRRIYAWLDGRLLSEETCRELFIYWHHRGLKQSTIHDYVNELKAFTNFLHIRGYTEIDVAKDLIRPHVPKRIRDFCSREMAEAMIIAGTEPDPTRPGHRCDNSRSIAVKKIVRLALRFDLRTGLRFEELTTRRVMDLRIDQDDPMIRVLGKGGDEELQPIYDDGIVEELRKYITDEQMQPNDVLFPVGKKVCNISLKRGRAKLGIVTEATCHSLRHIYGSGLLKDGFNIDEIRELLRHKDISTTMIYLHSDKSELAKKVNQKFRLNRTSLPFEKKREILKNAIVDTGLQNDILTNLTVYQVGERLVINYEPKS